ncbi:hypothetical protein M436DRAFT_38294 [Aureobasidium namibiae CBS 147.97]|uniref:F-box domain-containing protein n=1 Tax=Aureobasidium namibiae CBS 147.97 TaxID=1043004 RepID=A0A074WZ17_9PEZI|nr:uncharacterized protein M436DRAFT_38294 [Aureobasidium namibiae CBS 147.97]KEQ76724.1 hypothetical protein M436DRAFT_38294 [Aureobasidium namibiae CBS 147.97]
MVKRRAPDALGDGDERSTKRHQRNIADRLSRLSHELTLRVLSFLPVPDLITCQSISRHFHRLAGDDQLWKALYYNRFVRPRASRIPGINESGVPAESLWYSSKLSKWLDEDNLLKRERQTHWKRQYKTRHNWTKGTCRVDEVPVSPEPSVPPTLLQMHEGIIVMADHVHGLRAWSSQSGQDMLATAKFPDKTTPPSALTLDSVPSSSSTITLAVGFQDGSFTIYDLHAHQRRFVSRYSHEPSSNGLISAAALSFPYLATMTASQLLSFYKFMPTTNKASTDIPMNPPRLLQSLHSRTIWPPLTLSIRPQPDTVLVSIAYSLPTYLSGWTVGIQEMRLTPDGTLLESRLTSAIDQNYRPLTFNPSNSPPTPQTIPPFGHFNTSEANQIHSKPTSLSYSHPYLLVSHPDNTLTLYLVSSTTDALKISPGNRLWGHTSSVSGAHVGGRGKAVSVSTRGDELRVWELEGGFASASARRRLAAGELSVQLRPEKPSSPVEKEELSTGIDETSMTRGFVGFDDDKVVVLRERHCGNQALVVYDFT